MITPFPRTWVDVDLGRLGENLARVRAAIPSATQVALVAKADGYGHGLVPVARAALRQGADWVAVATVQEGIALRDAGLDAPVLVLSPVLEVEAEQAVFYRLRVMVETPELARALSDAAVAQRASVQVHLPIDTGLSRFGVSPAAALELAHRISAFPKLELEGVGTHFIDSGRDPATTDRQYAEFQTVVDRLRSAGFTVPVVHAANSAATLRHPAGGLDLVRVGIAAYGIDPYDLGGLQPLLSWHARVMAVRERPAGTSVSYSGTYVAPRPVRIATLGVGYGDGYPRALSNVGEVWLRGHRCPVRGLVCMDQTLVDVTDVPGVEVGDAAELIGPHITVRELAERTHTNVHEVITRIMSRVPRRYHHGPGYRSA